MIPVRVSLRQPFLAAALGLVLSQGAHAAMPPPGMPSPEQLSRWLRDRDATSERPIVLLGFRPGVTASSEGRVKVIDMARELPAVPAHSQAISWLTTTFPRLRVVCIPWQGQPADAQIAQALRTAQQEKPSVIYVPASAWLAQPESASHRALVEGWNREILFFTVLDPQAPQRPVPAGTLAVYLSESTAAETAPAGRAGLVLPAAFLGSNVGPDRTARLAHAASYVAGVAAALPVRNSPQHLERTARLALTGPTLGEAERTLDVARAFEPLACNFRFAGHTFQWSDRASAVGMDKAVFSPSGGRDAVVTGVNAEAPMRWLAAAALLADAEPTLFLPNARQSIVSLKPRLDDGPARTEHVRVLGDLLATQNATAQRDGLFNAVTREQHRLETIPPAPPVAK